MKENYVFLHVPLLKSDEKFSVVENLLLYLVVHTAFHISNLNLSPHSFSSCSYCSFMWILGHKQPALKDIFMV